MIDIKLLSMHICQALRWIPDKERRRKIGSYSLGTHIQSRVRVDGVSYKILITTAEVSIECNGNIQKTRKKMARG